MKRAILTLAAAAAMILATGTAHAWSGSSGLSFSASAARIQAKHSRYGKSVHPRSYYNRPVHYPPNYYYHLPRGRSYGHAYEYYGRGYEYGYQY